MYFLKKYFDSVFIILTAACLLMVSETGYLEKSAKYDVVIILAAYYVGKAIARWQEKITKVNTTTAE